MRSNRRQDTIKKIRKKRCPVCKSEMKLDKSTGIPTWECPKCNEWDDTDAWLF